MKKERKTCIICNRKRYKENMNTITFTLIEKLSQIAVETKTEWICKEHEVVPATETIVKTGRTVKPIYGGMVEIPRRKLPKMGNTEDWKKD